MIRIVDTNTSEIPKPTRQKGSRIDKTPEWAQLKAKLSLGLKPYEEILITFTKEDAAKYRLKGLRNAFWRQTRAYIQNLKLDYDTINYSSEGMDVIVVRHEPVLS
jgi:hypothetical protein